ncbi:TPR repeat-containing protein [Nitzschia inconspicua]|uniref:TPR repeat-containing protein n=1 Tax=Nitzschia inconspicua TaxID=303405 RepID=A0A9K3KE94_9STRA|nr:TPR repeat-containing protein [Nitzschia inconspicua]
MATASKDHNFLVQLLQSAREGDTVALEKTVQEYLKYQPAETTVSQLLSRFRDKKKRSAIHLACQSPRKTHGSDDNKDIVEFIVENSEWFPDEESLVTLVKQKDVNGFTPLMLAARHPDPLLAHQRVSCLLSHFPTLALARSKAGATALHYAAAAPTAPLPQTIQSLHTAAKVATHTFSTNGGGTPLHWACSIKREKNDEDLLTIEALLQCGALVNAHEWKDKEESIYAVPPPILVAVAAKNETACQRLLQCDDIDLNVAIGGDNTLLHLLVKSNMTLSLVTTLQKLRSDKEICLSALEKKNSADLNPMEMAANEGRIDCVRLLMGALNNENVSDDEATAYIQQHKSKRHELDQNAETRSSSASSATMPKLPRPIIDFEVQAQEQALSILSETKNISETNIHEALNRKKRGNQHFGKKEWQEAYDCYTEAMQYNPSEATFYSNRSSCLWNLGRLEEALEDAFICRTLRPDWSKACYRLAVARLSLGYCQEAAMAAWEGLQLDPNNKELKTLLQQCIVQGRERFRTTKGTAIK